ncbi:hypothetical protein [Sessilibacter corallicola]|uniref:Terpenoid synthase n=1 Tax=Sessilibacter corallicola TaxID=2904075 RepID=A0ABQ0ABC2_9GAMM|nr:hypothetical protein [Sessilibacter corallicola]MCE2028074.1 hypothetical protein [Sessilibacter corallicola]
MFEEKIALIRSVIDRESSCTDSDLLLEQWVADNRANLHRLIHIPEEKTNQALKQFVVRYVALIPECLEAFYDISKRINITDYSLMFLTIAADFILSEKQCPSNGKGIVRLIDEAYLAHRVFEELNDRFNHAVGRPLLPVDTFQANLIMHDLLGDQYANELDTAVLYAMEVNYEAEKRALSKLQPVPVEQLVTAIEMWPKLGEELFIHIKFMYE